MIDIKIRTTETFVVEVNGVEYDSLEDAFEETLSSFFRKNGAVEIEQVSQIILRKTEEFNNLLRNFRDAAGIIDKNFENLKNEAREFYKVPPKVF